MRASDIAGSLLYGLAAAIGKLSMRALARLGFFVAWWAGVFDISMAKVARRNLEMVYPRADPAGRERMRRSVLRGTFRGVFETLRFWTRPEPDNLRCIGEVRGGELFDAALASGKGLIIAAPHYGNWELLNQWLAARAPITVLYRRSKTAAGEAFLRRVRGRANVNQIPAEGSAMRGLFKALAAGGMVGILPDQQPKAGDGLWAPFFGTDALSMTLLPRLAQRTGANVLFAVAERREDGEGLRFDVLLQPAPAALADPDMAIAVAAMNAAVEAIARRDPAQYQWTYKRFGRRPPGSREPSPYDVDPGS